MREVTDDVEECRGDSEGVKGRECKGEREGRVKCTAKRDEGVEE